MASYLSSDSSLDALEDFSHAIFCNAELIAFVHYLFWDNILPENLKFRSKEVNKSLVIPRPDYLSSYCNFNNRIFSEIFFEDSLVCDK